MDKEQQYWMQRKGIKKWIYRNTHYRVSRMTFKLADRYVCGCKDDLEYVLQKKLFKPDHAFCIPPGIDDLYHQIPFREIKKSSIIFLGTWIERKGIRNLTNVVSEILKENKDYKFHVYGSWSMKDKILNSFSTDIRTQVTVFEKLSLPDLTEGILQSAIFFFPSYSEGFGLATVEAMSCSCAVVTTRTGVGSELSNSNNALLCDFNDEPAMKKAISALINDELLRKKIAYNGYMKAKSYQWNSQVNTLERVYTNWLNIPVPGEIIVSPEYQSLLV
jgi:glycosyltransferase involved in cell wall biosynthesis